MFYGLLKEAASNAECRDTYSEEVIINKRGKVFMRVTLRLVRLTIVFLRKQ